MLNKISRKYFIILPVCIVTGFIIGFSYNLSKEKRESGVVTTTEYAQENDYRQQLISQQERNKNLLEELNGLKGKIRTYEKDLASDEKQYGDMLEKANELRLLLGHLPAKGQGIKIQLEDGEYDPLQTNPNDYIIHESHLFMLINELKIAGAEALSINGQRLTATSYIVCNGPVITVDGKQYPAPFVVEAIGNTTTLINAVEIPGGVMDQLLNDQINVTIEGKDHIVLNTIHE
jgi:uncharacterized protein YlxW (UPF0749 family)